MSIESQSLLDVFAEMHRLKNENEMLRALMNEQAVRIDEMAGELGAVNRGQPMFLPLHQVTAEVDVDYSDFQRGRITQIARAELAVKLPWNVVKLQPVKDPLSTRLAYTLFVAGGRK